MAELHSVLSSKHQPNENGRKPLLIMGIGNLLMGDEGFGVHVARRLQTNPAFQDFDILDGGTGGFQLMQFFEDYETVILIDATLDDRPVGTIRLIQPRFSTDFPKALSTHDIGFKDVMDSLILLGRLPKIYLFVVSISYVQPLYMGLSEPVEKALETLETQILELSEKILLGRQEELPF